MTNDRLSQMLRQGPTALPEAAARDEEGLRLGAALAYIKTQGNLDGFARGRNERVALMTTVVRRGFVAWDRPGERYELTPLGEQHLATYSPGAAQPARREYGLGFKAPSSVRSRAMIAALAGTAACIAIVTWVSTGSSRIGLPLAPTASTPQTSSGAAQSTTSGPAADKVAHAPAALEQSPGQATNGGSSPAPSIPARQEPRESAETAGPSPVRAAAAQQQPKTASEPVQAAATPTPTEGSVGQNVAKSADAAPAQGAASADTSARAGTRETPSVSDKNHKHASRSGRAKRNEGRLDPERREEFEDRYWSDYGPGPREMLRSYRDEDRFASRRPRYDDGERHDRYTERYDRYDRGDRGDRGEFPNLLGWLFR